MRICRSTPFLLIAVAMFAFTHVSRAEPRTDSAGTAPLPAQHDNANPLPAVALSYDGRYVAWIVPRPGRTELVLASGSASRPHTVDIPGECNAEGIRWAHRWNKLAVLTRCAAGAGSTKSIHGAIWLLDPRAGTPPLKLADVDGFAEGLQWASDDKRIAFLYRPDAASAVEAGSSSPPQASVSAGRSVVVAVTVPGGPLQVLTPSALYVHEFHLSRIGHKVAYTATPSSGGDQSTATGLYTQQAIANATPVLAFDPGTAQRSLHDLQITLPRWSPSGQIFFLGRLAGDHDTTGGDLYRLVAGNGGLQNLTGQQRIKPTWFTFHRDHLLVTQIVDGTTQVAGYCLMGSWAKQTALLFTVPGVIGDGRAPSAISASYTLRRPRVAYFQRETAQASPVLHVGSFGTFPPPMVASINAAHPVDSTSPAPAN